jgi:molybdopterin-guanine dinucleotide biosynthesis protein A
MGQDKATMRVGEDTLIGRTHGVVRDIFPDIMVVSSLHASIEDVPVRIVHDVLPVPGSLTGIASALLDADTPYVFILGCDMPFLTPEAILYMMDQVHGEQVIVPRTDGGFEPLHAIYHRSCLSSMLTYIERGHMKIERLFPLFSVRPLPPDPAFLNHGVSVFTNVNTREDLNRAKRALG